MEEEHRKTQAEIDLADSQNEASGLNGSKSNRFYARPEHDAKSQESEKKKSERFVRDLEWMLFNNPSYAALYHRVEKAFEQAGTMLDTAYEQVKANIHNTHLAITLMEKNASTLHDGTAVFKSEDGKKAYTKDGRELSKLEIDQVLWSNQGSSWEDYTTLKVDYQKYIEDKETLENYQTDIMEPMGRKLESKDTIPEKQLEDLANTLENIVNDPIVRHYEKTSLDLSQITESQAILESDSGLNAPDIKSHFNTVNTTIPDLSTESIPVLTPKIT